MIYYSWKRHFLLGATMTIKGTFKNGVVIPDEKRNIPDGTPVEILVKEVKPLSESLLRFAGVAKGLPPDFARNHDHYIHGAPKRPEKQ
jgi:hypothetical protein